MPTTFSVGDIISVSLLVKDLIGALHNSRGSAAEYQEIIRELWSLDRALLQVEILSRSFENSVELNALCAMARHTVDSCRLSMAKFLGTIRKYETSLRVDGSGNVVKDMARKLQWQTSMKDELGKFRAEVVAHCSSINMLMNTAQLNILRLHGKNLNGRITQGDQRDRETMKRQDEAITELKDLMKEHNVLLRIGNKATESITTTLRLQWLRNLGGELMALMQKTFHMNVEMYKAVLAIQNLLPTRLERTLFQEPFILEDAIGRHFPIQLQWTTCWEAFEVVLELHFKNIQGQTKVRNKEYVFQESATGRDIERSRPWTGAFLPGQKVNMSLIFRYIADDGNANTSCPKCHQSSTQSYEKAIQCAKCDMWYQRIIEVKKADTYNVDDSCEAPITTKAAKPTAKKRSFDEVGAVEDDLRCFKRVRFICERHLPVGTQQSKTFRRNHDRWERLREDIHQMYVTENNSLQKTMVMIHGKHGFRASERKWKEKLKDWGYARRARAKSMD